MCWKFSEQLFLKTLLDSCFWEEFWSSHQLFFKLFFDYWNSLVYVLPKQISLTLEYTYLYKKTKSSGKNNHDKVFSFREMSSTFLGLTLLYNVTHNNLKFKKIYSWNYYFIGMFLWTSFYLFTYVFIIYLFILTLHRKV